MSEKTSEIQPTDRIGDICRGGRGLSLRFRALENPVSRTVQSKKWGTVYRVAEILVADHSAMISLILWNDDIAKVEKGMTYVMEGGYITVVDECMKLNKGRNGVLLRSPESIDKVNKEINMSRPFVGEKPSRIVERERARTLDGTATSRFRRYCSHKDF